MKYIIIILITLLNLLGAFLLLLNSFENYKLPNNKKVVYISTWDDIYNIESFKIISNMFNKHNIPITMYIQTGPLNEEYIKEYNKIIDPTLNNNVQNIIGSHTISHDSASDDPKEYIDSQKIIKKIFGEKHGNTLSYPYGHINNNTNIKNIIKNTYIAARNFDINDNYVNLLKTELFNLPKYRIENVNNSVIQNAIKNNYGIITCGHGIEGIGGWNPISQEKLEKHIKELLQYKDDIWFTTLSEFVKYIKK